LQAEPSCAHTAAVPPHLPLVQSALQQSPEVVHDAPSAAHVGAVHVPDWQLPLQHSLAWEQLPPADVQEEDGDGVTHTPAHDVLQQSLHDVHAVPAAAHAFVA
jgi:hypothetical protein